MKFAAHRFHAFARVDEDSLVVWFISYFVSLELFQHEQNDALLVGLVCKVSSPIWSMQPRCVSQFRIQSGRKRLRDLWHGPPRNQVSRTRKSHLTVLNH